MAPDRRGTHEDERLRPWMGHMPRDRGSIWYLAPLMLCVMDTAILALVASAAVMALLAR